LKVKDDEWSNNHPQGGVVGSLARARPPSARPSTLIYDYCVSSSNF
jgi:hypothetical protein